MFEIQRGMSWSTEVKPFLLCIKMDIGVGLTLTLNLDILKMRVSSRPKVGMFENQRQSTPNPSFKHRKHLLHAFSIGVSMAKGPIPRETSLRFGVNFSKI
jgi:hypothetical protein